MEILAGIFFVSFGVIQFTLPIQAEPVIHIDIPVNLKKANVVFNISHVDFAGDVPAGIKYMKLLSDHFKEWDPPGQTIGIFHWGAG
jgi:hypothetical protein